MQLQYIPFTDLVFLENNPRTRTDEGLRKMADDISRDPNFYDNRPTLVNYRGGIYQVYAGDLRAHAAHMVLGWEKIPCNVENDVSDEVMMRRAILDNSHREKWDYEKLAAWEYDRDELEDMGVNWSIDDNELGGSDTHQKDNSLNSEMLEDDEVPEIKTGKSIIQNGDLVYIGRHRLFCGDSCDGEQVKSLFAGDLASLILTDPPYGVSYVGKTSESLTIENDSLSEEDTARLWDNALGVAFDNTKDGGAIYATIPPGSLQTVFVDALKARGALRQVLIWDKGTLVLGRSDYHYAHEPILYGWKPGAPHFFIDDRTKTSVIRVPKPQRNGEHPTMKPIALWAELMNNSSLGGWLVYDPFLGSGTTMLVAERIGRICYGCELSPNYCDVIVRRMITENENIAVIRGGEDIKHLFFNS